MLFGSSMALGARLFACSASVRNRFFNLLHNVKQLSLLALPILGGEVMGHWVAVADVLFVGRYDTKSLASLAVATALFWNITIIGIGVLISFTPLMAEAFGARRYTQHRTLFYQSIWTAICVGIFTGVLVLFAAYVILPRLSYSPQLIHLTQQYLLLIVLGSPFLMAAQAIGMFFNSLQTGIGMLVMGAVMLITNVVLDYGLIFGRMGLPELGLLGAGVATMVGYMVACVVMVALLIIRKDLHAPLKLRPLLEKVPFKDTLIQVQRALPLMWSLLSETALFTLPVLFASHLGAIKIGATQIVMTMGSSMFMVVLSFGNATSSRIGYLHGQGRHKQAQVTVLGLVLVVLSVILTLLSLIYLNADRVFGFFTQDPKVMAVLMGVFWIWALSVVTDSFQTSFAFTLRGFHDYRALMIISSIGFIGFGLPVLFGLTRPGLGLDVQGIFLAVLLTTSFTSAMLSLRYRHVQKKTLQQRLITRQTLRANFLHQRRSASNDPVQQAQQRSEEQAIAAIR